MTNAMNAKRTAVAAVSATLLISGSVSGVAMAADQSADGPGTTGATPLCEQASGECPSTVVKADAAQGQFSWSQDVRTPNAVIKAVFAKAAAALCQARTDFIADNPLKWQISVTGDVNNAYTAPVDELAEEESVSQTMSCTCGGNPSDGKATITADVKGLPVNYLVSRAAAHPGVNTITFVASDGTEVAMPLAYVVGHHGVLSFELNGEDLSASVGGNNQLWLAGTSANYFVRDVVEIRVTKEAQAPENPGEGMEYPNSPNAGILAATVS